MIAMSICVLDIMMKHNFIIKCMFAIIIFLLINISLLPVISSTSISINKFFGDSRAVILVDDDGDGDYSNIQDAIDNASEGDTIEVYSGTYTETDIIVDKQLILQGIDSELGGGGGTGKPLIINNYDDKKVIKVTMDGCSIFGFHIISTGCCSRGIYLYQSNNHNVYQNEIDKINNGIILWESSNNKVYENEVTETTSSAISSSYNSFNNQIFDNFVFDCGYGIMVDNFAENINVYNNTIRKINAIGIDISRANNNTIHRNKITSCSYGISLWMEDGYGYNNNVTNNLITSCGRGIYLTGKDHKIYQNTILDCEYGIRMETLESIPPVYCCNNTVFENTIINSRGQGIFLDGVYTTDVFGNTITGSIGYGLNLDNAKMNNIFENNITYNGGDGIHLLASEGNVIYHNNFIGNSDNAFCYGDPWDRHNRWNLGYTNDGGGNYWDDYKGNDRNGDGIGDRPYVIPDLDYNRLNNDRDEYPLMEPDGRPNCRPYPYTKSYVKIIEQSPILQLLIITLNQFIRNLRIFDK
jgi:parallel beta-helix repeat protein